MKNKLILVSFFLMIGLLAVGAKFVLAQTTLPRVTTACEGKTGLLMGIDDGFSILKKCPGNSRKVALGSGEYNNVSIEGDVLFFYQISVGDLGTIKYVLMKDGHMYQKVSWENNGQYWQQIGEIPENLMQVGIVEWKIDYFITTNGRIYYKGAEAPTDGEWTYLDNVPTITQ